MEALSIAAALCRGCAQISFDGFVHCSSDESGHGPCECVGWHRSRADGSRLWCRGASKALLRNRKMQGASPFSLSVSISRYPSVGSSTDICAVTPAFESLPEEPLDETSLQETEFASSLGMMQRKFFSRLAVCPDFPRGKIFFTED